MKNRIAMFMIVGLLACLMAADAPAQCVTNPDGSITCPTLAPPLPAVVAAEAAAGSEQDPPITADQLSVRERRKLGFTRLHGVVATIKLARQGVLRSPRGLTGEDLEAAEAEIREAIAVEIMGDNLASWDEVIRDRDWKAFLDALADFFERIMPIILEIIERFGGLAQDAALTPTVTVANCVPVVGPPVMLAA